MKVKCPVCPTQGILETRGNSQRIIHYQYVDGKRIFSRHKVGTVGYSDMGTVGTELGTEKTDKSISCQNKSWGWELNPYPLSIIEKSFPILLY